MTTDCLHPWNRLITQGENETVMCTVCCDVLSLREIARSRDAECLRLAHVVRDASPEEQPAAKAAYYAFAWGMPS